VAVATGGPGDEEVGVDCAADARALGGGTSTTDATPGSGLFASVPTMGHTTNTPATDGATPTGWLATWSDISFDQTVTVFAICAPDESMMAPAAS
jgi:hypothetical protein